jgi:SAM-dependent methyltransferase
VKKSEIPVFDLLEEINSRPEPFQFYTAEELWTDEHTSAKMLEYHLNESVDLASRNRDFISRSAEWIISHFELDAKKKIADFGCGPGLYTNLFAESGSDVTGVDFSKRSIQYARKVADEKNLRITYVQQNYLDFETEKKFDLITMIFCDYCALSPSQRQRLLTRFFTFLKPGGAILLDVHSLNTYNSRDEVAVYECNQLDSFWSPDSYYGFLNTFKYQDEKLTLDKYTIIEKKRTRVVYNWIQYFNQESLKREFEESGFMVEEFYSDVAGSNFSPESPDFAIVARKRKSQLQEK